MLMIERPTIETTPVSVTEKKPPRGLSAQWQKVEGKLICVWFKNPD